MTTSRSNNIDDMEELQGGAAQQTTSKEKRLWLAEVFNVVYRGRDNIKPQKQIGKIKVSDGVNDHYLYKVEEVDEGKPSLQQIDELVLSGPTKSSISAQDSLKIDVDLFGGAFKDALYIDDCPTDDFLKKAVPLEFELLVDIHLMTGDEIDIYEDTVSFQAHRTGTSIEVLTGKNCKIEVKVKWKCGE
ncbi:hypothetical protein POM88_049912 [Heracleum sosnowskyi]|uniref:Uncharacterized protein n=1 Tax=Heracleum sosnowskyi TaxID=360622 RepID=A0AAD8M0Z6_9APIA|nr:hypothetical protein POM88_049912 [Heracleum sosnowskyi]